MVLFMRIENRTVVLVHYVESQYLGENCIGTQEQQWPLVASISRRSVEMKNILCILQNYTGIMVQLGG